MPSTRHLGPISLAACVLGMVACEALIHGGVLVNPWWRVLAAGFEAGTVGGMADWFAVSALFRDVPIPLLRRHTNIIVRNRPRIVENLKSYVQNKLLTPTVIRERLQEVSFSRALLAYLDFGDNRTRVHDLVRSAAGGLVAGLDREPVVVFLERAAKERLLALDLAQPLGGWLAQALARGDHDALWDALLAEAAGFMHEPRVRSRIINVMRTAAAAAKDQGGPFKRLFLRLGETTGGVDYELYADQLVAATVEWLAEVRADRRNSLRQMADERLRGWALALADGRPDAVAAVERLKRGIVERGDFQGLIRSALAAIKATASAELSDRDSAFSRTLAALTDELIGHLRTDQRLQAYLDQQAREAVCAFVERNHDLIGEMVGSSLSPERISDRELVAQIEDRVGGDLQYIRLNGAIVGGMVGAVITAFKLLLT